MRTWFVGLLAIVIGILLAPSAFAQNAQITGSVKDSSGAIIPGATVTARNVDTGLTRTAVTEGAGEYRLPSLPPGRYSVAAELSGFSTETRPDIILIIDQTAILNFTLKPATIAETVTVTGDSPIVDVTRSDVSTSVSTQQIQDLPVASRRWIDLAMLTPGTSQDNIRGQFYRGNVNVGAGGREYSNGFVVDGVNNTWAEMGEPRQNFAMDAIQEFKVSTSTYKAEYGLATGGLVAVVTKSGTNQFHGSGLLFLRDASITAKEFFQTTKPDYRRYQYGGTIGGPIVKDKTHFFFAYEGTQEKQFLTVNAKGLWPQYEGTFLSDQTRWTYNAKLDHQTGAGTEPVLPLRRRRRVPADHHGRRHDRRDRQLRLRGAAQVGGARPHLGDQLARAERRPLPVRVREVRGVAAVQPRRLGAGRFHRAAAAVHAGLHLSVDHRRRLRQRADGPRVALAGEGRLLIPDARVGRHASVEDGRRLQQHPVRRRQHEFAARQLDVPEGRALQRQRSDHLSDAVHELAADLRQHSDQDLRRLHPGRLAGGERSDVQPRPALRPAEGLVQRGPARTCSRAFRTSSDATARFRSTSRS